QFFFFSSRRRHTRFSRDWSSDVCSSDLTILKLDKSEFIDKWDDAVSAIKSSVDFFRSYGIPVSRLLPYNTLIVPFAYFFHYHPRSEERRVGKDCSFQLIVCYGIKKRVSS